MRFISTRVHGVLDYLMGVVLISAPWLLGFNDASNQWAVYIPVILGIGVIAYSLLTRYELGAFRVIPMSGHLAMDVFGGALLAASPWLFGFADEVYLPHLIFGIAEMGAGLMTRTHPDAAWERDHGHHGTPMHPAH